MIKLHVKSDARNALCSFIFVLLLIFFHGMSRRFGMYGADSFLQSYILSSLMIQMSLCVGFSIH